MALITKTAEYVIVLEIAKRKEDSSEEAAAHMTVAYCGKKKPEFSELDRVAIRFNLNKMCAKITGEDFLGPDLDIPVWIIGRESLAKEQNEYLNTLWDIYNVEQPYTKGRIEQLLHVTKKGAAATFNVNDTICFSKFSAKQIGSKHAPFFSVNLL